LPSHTQQRCQADSGLIRRITPSPGHRAWEPPGEAWLGDRSGGQGRTGSQGDPGAPQHLGAWPQSTHTRCKTHFPRCQGSNLTPQRGRHSGMWGGQGVMYAVGGTHPPPRQQGGAHGHPLHCSWGRATKTALSLGQGCVRNMNLRQ